MIDWNLARGPSSFENALSQGLQFGTHLAQRRQQEEQRNALSAYAIDPNNEKNFNALAVAAPEVALQFRAQRDAAAREARVGELTRLGAQGSEEAILELWGFDRQAAAALDTRARERALQGINYIGNSALAIDSLPEEQRAAAWDAAIDQGVQMGFANLAQFRGRYSPQSLEAMVARAGQTQTMLNNRNPDIFSVQAGGSAFGRDAQGNLFPVIVPNYQGAPAGAPAGPQGGYGAGVPSGSPLSQPAPQAAAPQRQSPLFPAAEWREYTRAMGTSLPAIVERDRPVIINSQGAQVQTDVINGQIAYLVNGVWYDNPEGQD